MIVESGSSYTSFGDPDPWVKLANELQLPSWVSPGGNRVHLFDLQGSVNWANKLPSRSCVSVGTCCPL